ncbi:MAG: MFS transporter [Bacteroidales bacterium]
MEHSDKHEKQNLYIILTITLLSVIGVTSIVPVFGDMSNALNVSLDKIGWLITVFTLPSVLLGPAVGMIIDRYGRKRILIAALILFGITGTMCFFTRVFETILILRFFQGLGAACLGIINVTLIGDIFTGSKRAKAMGYNSGAISVGSAIFPAIGGLLAAINWYYPFLLPALAIFVAVWVYFGLHNPEPIEKAHLSQYIRSSLKSIFKREAITLFLLCFASFILLFGVIMTYMPILLKDKFSLSSTQIGLMFFVLALSTAGVASQLDRISRVLPIKHLIVIGFVTYLIGFALIPFVDNVWMLLLLMLIIGVGQGINIPAIFNLLTSIAPFSNRGAFMSVNSMAIRAGQTAGPLLAGILFGLWGMSWVFWSGAILASFFVLLIIVFIPLHTRA